MFSHSCISREWCSDVNRCTTVHDQRDGRAYPRGSQKSGLCRRPRVKPRRAPWWPRSGRHRWSGRPGQRVKPDRRDRGNYVAEPISLDAPAFRAFRHDPRDLDPPTVLTQRRAVMPVRKWCVREPGVISILRTGRPFQPCADKMSRTLRRLCARCASGKGWTSIYRILVWDDIFKLQQLDACPGGFEFRCMLRPARVFSKPCKRSGRRKPHHMKLDQPIPATQSPLERLCSANSGNCVVFICRKCCDPSGRCNQHECNTGRRHGSVPQS